MCNLHREGNFAAAVELSQKLLEHVGNGGKLPKVLSDLPTIDRLRMLQFYANIEVLEQLCRMKENEQHGMV